MSAGRHDGAAPPQAQKLASESEPRFLRETGANLSARIALSMLNGEPAGMFTAQFDGGRRGRFSYVFDPMGRIPFAAFGLNGGEKGLIYKFGEADYFTEVWMAFYAESDYARKTVEYTDAHQLVDIQHYKLNVDLRNFTRAMGLVARMDMKTLAGNLRSIPFQIGEGLGVYQEERLKNQLRLKAARLDGAAVPFAQEDWEGGFTVFLPEPVPAGQAIALEMEFEGSFIDGIPAGARGLLSPQQRHLDAAPRRARSRHVRPDVPHRASGTRSSRSARARPNSRIPHDPARWSRAMK